MLCLLQHNVTISKQQRTEINQTSIMLTSTNEFCMSGCNKTKQRTRKLICFIFKLHPWFCLFSRLPSALSKLCAPWGRWKETERDCGWSSARQSDRFCKPHECWCWGEVSAETGRWGEQERESGRGWWRKDRWEMMDKKEIREGNAFAMNWSSTKLTSFNWVVTRENMSTNWSPYWVLAWLIPAGKEQDSKCSIQTWQKKWPKETHHGINPTERGESKREREREREREKIAHTYFSETLEGDISKCRHI